MTRAEKVRQRRSDAYEKRLTYDTGRGPRWAGIRLSDVRGVRECRTACNRPYWSEPACVLAAEEMQ
jgi:hypothetical protein